jgi:hypothetical protein
MGFCPVSRLRASLGASTSWGGLYAASATIQRQGPLEGLSDMLRLQCLGARVLQESHAAEGCLRWTIMADPEGNEFCAFVPA